MSPDCKEIRIDDEYLLSKYGREALQHMIDFAKELNEAPTRPAGRHYLAVYIEASTDVRNLLPGQIAEPGRITVVDTIALTTKRIVYSDENAQRDLALYSYDLKQKLAAKPEEKSNARRKKR